MSLDDALGMIAEYLGLDADLLRTYAAEDHIGGFDFDPEKAAFPCGSLWGVEGQVLYALMRALQPNYTLELGVWHGASTTHLLSALHRNAFGIVVSVDWWDGAGSLVPQSLRSGNWLMVYSEAVAFIQTQIQPDTVNFCFEDCIHSTEEICAIVTALRPKLRPDAVVIHHDSEHGDDGQHIKQGLENAGIRDYLSVLIEPSDCGLLVWRT